MSLKKALFKWGQNVHNGFQRSRINTNGNTLSYRNMRGSDFVGGLKWLGFLGGFTLMHYFNRRRERTFCADSDQAKKPARLTDLMTREEKLELVKDLRIHEIGIPRDFPEGVPREIIVNHEGQDFPVLVVRFEGRLYATGAYDTYDDKSRLIDGVLFGDKIYSPNNGSAFCIKTGTVEYGPAIDNLPIFATGEKQGKVFVWIPVVPPKKVMPMTCYRDFNDPRKIVIVGSGVAAYTCLQTLRQQEFSGEIKLITTDMHLPYDKSRLTKQFKGMDYKKLYFREEEFYEDHGIEFHLGREATNIVNRHGRPYLELSDEYKMEYDALMIATGTTTEDREIPGAEEAENCLYLRGIDDHKEIVKRLDTAKEITLLGVNVSSLEVASTLRKEYPHLKVNVIDENETLATEHRFGQAVSDALIDLHKKHGVNFNFEGEIERFNQDPNRKEVKEIVFKNGKKVKTDLVLYFPNNYLANTEWVVEGENTDNLEFDDHGKIKTDYNQRTDHKRIFAAGDCTSSLFFTDGSRLNTKSWYVAYHQGVIAALNIMALRIPYTTIPYFQTEQYNQTLRYSGQTENYYEVYIDGDVSKWDFIAYYAKANGEISAALASDSRRRDILVINEALRLQMMPDIEEIKDKTENIKTIERAIRESQRSGCYMDAITEVNDKFYPQDVLWINREPTDKYFSSLRDPKTPMGPNEATDNE